MKAACPKCRRSNIRKAQQRGFQDLLLRLLFVFPHRCRVCRQRFYRFTILTTDDNEPVRWSRLEQCGSDLAAIERLALAQYNLGIKYATGKGAAQNDCDAAKCFRLAALQGNALAQYNLGYMYANGRGVEKNEAEAANWYRLAAERGIPEAQCNLGLLYAQGLGVPQDSSQAERWYRLAAGQGCLQAMHNLQCLRQADLLE